MDIKIKQYLNPQTGVALISTLMLCSISLLVVGALITSTQNNSKMQGVVRLNHDRFYDVEDNLGRAAAWFDSNQEYVVTLFKDTNFASNFVVSDSYLAIDESTAVGGYVNNQKVNFTVPSNVKVNDGSGNYPIISNNSNFGISHFPTGINSSGVTKNLVSDFATNFPNSDNGGVNIKIILTGVVITSLGYSPTFRIDAITGNAPDRGTNLYSNVYGAFENTSLTTSYIDDTSGFYGHTKVDMSGNSNCRSVVFSWNSATSAWTKGAIAYNCLVQSNGTIPLAGSGIKVYGAAKTNAVTTIDTSRVYNNNAAGCTGAGCHNAILNTFNNSWLPSADAASDLSLGSHTTLAPGTYRNVSIGPNKTLTLGTPGSTSTYYMKSLNLIGGQSKIQPHAGLGQNDVVYLYVNEIVGDHLNGKQLYNTTKAPHLFKVIYTGSTLLTLNGTAEMRAHVYAPYAEIKINGTFIYYGAINALTLTTIGTADLFSDEVLHDNTTVAVVVGQPELSFVIKKVNFRFR